MSERTTITQVTNIGVEATSAKGTLVPANRRLSSISITPNVSAETDMFRPSGSKFHTLQSQNKEWVDADLAGKPTYTEIIYVLASLITTPVPAAGSGATAGITDWVFEPSMTTEDNPTTYSVEKGSGVRAHRFAYGLITTMGLNFGRSAIDLSGKLIGQRLEDSITMTPSPTSLGLVPILPSQVSVYLDDTAANLGNTKLTRIVSVDTSLGDRYNPAWFLDSSNASWATHVEKEPTLTAAVVAEANSEGMSLALGRLRAGDTKFLRIEAIGPVVGTTSIPHRFRMDMAVKVESPGNFDDSDGIYTINPTLRGVFDPTWGKALSISVRNGISAL